ncbi:MAG: hypothetical protein AB8B56_18300 [Crocinitomicaceae bacterium]
MIHPIKSISVVFFLLFLSCSGNAILDREQSGEPFESQIVENTEDFTFYRSFQFCDNPYAAFTQEEADEIYRDKTFTLDGLKVERKRLDWNSYFFEGAKDCVVKELGEAYTSSYLVSIDDESPFDEIVVLNDKYILVAQDGFFFTFTKNDEGDNSHGQTTIKSEELHSSESRTKLVLDAQENSKTISLPLEYSYELISDLEGFTPINKEVVNLSKLDHLLDMQYAKLQTLGQTTPLLITGVMESGQSELYLVTLNNDSDIVDDVLLYECREIENGTILTRFKIDTKGEITITIEENVNKRSKILKENSLRVNSTGEIVSL